MVNKYVIKIFFYSFVNKDCCNRGVNIIWKSIYYFLAVYNIFYFIDFFFNKWWGFLIIIVIVNVK